MINLQIKIKDLIWCEDARNWDDYTESFTDILYYLTEPLENGGRLTVLDRLTGYSGYVRDIETGYRDEKGEFYCASGGFDIRDYPELTIEEAIDKIIANSGF